MLYPEPADRGEHQVARAEQLLCRVPPERCAEPGDIVDTVPCLLGGGPAMISGICFRVDGGCPIT